MSGYLARLVALAIAGLAATAHAPAAAAGRPPCAELRAKLQRSAVPVLLPGRLPTPIEPIASIAVITSGSDGYYIGFSPVPNCSGALSCATLHVAGFTHSSGAAHAFGHDRPVRLPDGSRGFYSPRDCSGASCTEASLSFKRAGAVYEIDAKVGRDDLPVLINIYRSLRCFACVPRECHGR